METPIITTKQPGCQEVVDDGRTGLLCELQNVPDLVDKMEQFILMDKTDRLIMGKNARLKMERQFDESIIIQHYLNLLQQDFLLPGVQEDAMIPVYSEMELSDMEF